jgi:hypothetical protein
MGKAALPALPLDNSAGLFLLSSAYFQTFFNHPLLNFGQERTLKDFSTNFPLTVRVVAIASQPGTGSNRAAHSQPPYTLAQSQQSC